MKKQMNVIYSVNKTDTNYPNTMIELIAVLKRLERRKKLDKLTKKINKQIESININSINFI